MIQIEFRVWEDDKIIPEMSYGDLNSTRLIERTTDKEKMLYINVNDKNRKKIFQKDICKYFNDLDKDGIGIIEDDYIKWISGTIAKTNLMTPLYYLKRGSEFEVLGNIYENPELLEQGRVVTQ